MNKAKKSRFLLIPLIFFTALAALSMIFSLKPSLFLWGKASVPSQEEPLPQISYKLPPGFSELLVFQSDTDGDADLYLLSQKGIKKLTDNNFPDEYPLFSPDGKKILYQATPEERTHQFNKTLDTGQIERVIQEQANFWHPCWAPDGKAIAFDTDLWGGKEVARFDLEKKVMTRLTDTSGENILSAWSPDGEKIAFSGHRLYGWRVYLLDLATGKTRSLTDRGNCRPDWSPDGNWIAMVSNNGSKYDIFLMRPDGTDIQPLTKDPDEQEYDPCWSRDGKRVYFHKSAGGKKPPFHIWVINADGSQPFQITFGDSQDFYPDAY